MKFEKVCVAKNSSQNVIEVVRDSSRQHTERFELLHLVEFIFDAQPFRDIAKHKDSAERDVVLVACEGVG